MTFVLLVAAIVSGCFVDALVGILGSRRRIGFGWAFFLSLVLTPLVGLIITLISDSLPQGERRWGCLMPTLLSLVFVTLVVILAVAVCGVAVNL